MVHWFVIAILSFEMPQASEPRLYDFSADGQAKEAERLLNEGPEKLKKYLPAILADQKLVFESGLIPNETRGKRDAGEILNTRIPYRSFKAGKSKNKFERVDCSKLKQPLKIPAAAAAFVDLKRKDWLEHHSKIDFSQIELAWMKELLAYDHWKGPYPPNIETSCPPPPLGSLEFESRAWARLRLLKGLKENDLPQASKEVRHLAFILASDDFGIGPLGVNAIISDERKLLERYPVKGLAPVDPSLTAALSRYVVTSIGLIGNPDVVPEEEFKKVFFSEHSLTSFCSAFAYQFVMASLETQTLELTESYQELFRKLEQRFKDKCSGHATYALKKKLDIEELKRPTQELPAPKNAEEKKLHEAFPKIRAASAFRLLSAYEKMTETKKATQK